MRVVLDTNIISSRYLTPHGRVARIIDRWEQDAFELLASEVVLSEDARVLRYPRHRRARRLTDAQLAETDDAFRAFSEAGATAASPHGPPTSRERASTSESFGSAPARARARWSG